MTAAHARHLLIPLTVVMRNNDPKDLGTVIDIDYAERKFLVVWANVRPGEWISFDNAKEISIR